MFFMDASAEISIKKDKYLKSVKRYVWGAYQDDAGNGDLTTDLFVPDKKRKVTAVITAKESGTLAGIQEAKWLLEKLGVQIKQSKKDGAPIKKGDRIMKLEGRADKLLAAERTLLNVLQRMSGIATKTHELVVAVPKNIKILATRKTLWGDLDKRAVSVGGGLTHRLNLADAILIKENHIILLSESQKIDPGLDPGRKSKIENCRFMEIEFENIEQIKTFAKGFRADGREKPIVMLDDFTPPQIKQALLILKKTGVPVEISGGINLKNIKKYCLKGVGAISSGCITNKAPCLDFSLKIIA